MRKKDDKTRTISFFSQKNQQVIIVSSAMAKKYALDMEKDDSVIKYEANIPLTDFAVVVDGKGLRRKLLETEWVSDFMVVKQDGTKIVEIRLATMVSLETSLYILNRRQKVPVTAQKKLQRHLMQRQRK